MTAESDYPYINPPDPSQASAPLRSHAGIVRQTAAWTASPPATVAATGGSATVADTKGGRGKAPDTVPGPKESAGWVSRRAMSAEARQGKLYIFMPPTETLDDYLELVAAVEFDRNGARSADHHGRLRAAG